MGGRAGERNHDQYSVETISLSLSQQVEFVLSRRWMMQVVSVFLPTSMLLCIGYSTLFVRVSLLQVRSSLPW